MTFPHETQERAKERSRLEEAAADRARVEARRSYLSMRCGFGNHAPAGCQNDGTGCLCPCHDELKEVSA